jgi:hypothetical protein
MADEITGVTIPELPEGGTLTGAEQFEMVQDGVSRRTTADEIKTLAAQLTADELAAVQAANSPAAINPFATVADLGLSSIESTTLDVSITDGVATVDGIGGDYEPTITNEAGLSSTSVTAGFYSRTGNIVTASFTIELQLAALSTNGSLDFSLPILPAANFANSRKLTGVYSVNNGLLSNVNLGILSSTSDAKTASFILQVSVAAVSVGLNIVIQYSLV